MPGADRMASSYTSDNDMSPHQSSRERQSHTPPIDSQLSENLEHTGQQATSKQKRIACIICRKRKLRCDGERPSCGTCSRLNHKCAYDDVRKKSGPKRGYVKDLEARLSQLESQLRAKNSQSNYPSTPQPPYRIQRDNLSESMDQSMLTGFANVNVDASGQQVPDLMVSPHGELPYTMTSLGLEEPLPPQEMIDEMHSIYFEKMASSCPIIHKYRYYAAMSLAHHMRPAICLRYVIWALVCSITDKYLSYANVFYQRARKYAELDEMKGHGESFITVGHAQCWVLLCVYEQKMLFFPRAWMSAGKSVRLALMLGLHRQDGQGLDVKQVIAPAKDWTDKEERRRTFWAAYCNDRYASIGTGWPMCLDEEDIMTNLPASIDAYEKSREEETSSIKDAMSPDGAKNLSSYAGVVLIACLIGKILVHLHRSTDSDNADDPTGQYWRRHDRLDTTIANIALYLPDHLRSPRSSDDPNVAFLNMSLHAVTICLHQAAILKAEKHTLNTQIIRDSTNRCFHAAGNIVSLMRLISNVDLSTTSPHISFCLYVALRIYTHEYKKRPKDESIRKEIDFLLVTMQAHRKKNPITESFLVLNIVELDNAGLEHCLYRPDQTTTKPPHVLLVEGENCPPVFQPHSKTQPGFIDVQSRESTSPVVRNMSYATSHSSDTRVNSPQPPQSSFRLSSRASSASLHPQQTPVQPVLRSQGWANTTPMFPTSAENEMASSAHTVSDQQSQRSSSRPAYSPQPRADNPLESTPPQHQVQSGFYSQPVQAVQAVHYQNFSVHPGGGFGHPAGNMHGQQTQQLGGAYSMAPELEMHGFVPEAVPDNSWMQDIGMDDANEYWRTLPTSVGPNQ